MHYEITASTQAVRKEMTTAQRKSSLFAEAPRVGATTLRRGQVLKLSPEQFAHRELSLKRLFLAHAIEIFRVEGKSRFSMRDQKRSVDSSPKEAEEAGEKFDPVKAKADREAAEKLLAEAEAADAELLKMLSEAPVEKPVEAATQETPVVETAPATEPVVHAEAPTVVEETAPAAPPEVIVPPPPPSAPAAPVSESHGKKGKKGSK